MKNLEMRLEQLVKQGRISLSEAFALTRKLGSLSPGIQDSILKDLEEGCKSASDILDDERTENHSQREEDFQKFTQRMKEFGKEVGAELESLVSDFDKERFKANVQSMFNDVSDTFKSKSRTGERVIHGDHQEDSLVLLDQLLVEGNGKYGTLTVQGKLTLDGDLDVRTLKGSGQLLVKGRLKCKKLDYMGEISCQSDMQGGSINNRGRIYVKGDTSGGDLINEGTFNSQGDIQLIRLVNSGSLSADRSLRSDRVESTGILNCLGMMRAGFIDMKEGRVILMEGEQIHLGSGCRVEDLAYTDSCKEEEGSRVNRKRNIS